MHGGVGIPKPDPSRGEQGALAPPGFAAFRAAYPKRAGSQRWAEALERYTANIAAGHTEQVMLEGATRYAAFCEAEQITGTAQVQQAKTFLGDNLDFLEAWTASPKPEDPITRWVRGGERSADDAVERWARGGAEGVSDVAG